MYKYPKQILTVEQQIQSYIDAGMKIDSYTDVEKALKTIGYYRLRGYSFQIYNNSIKMYSDGAKFSNILNIYKFDQKLSNIIFSMISKIEITLRVRVIEALLIYNDPLILYNAYIFNDKKVYWQNMSTIASEIARSNDVFIKHNFDNHDGEVPIWAVVEVISFGTLSKIIKNLKTENTNAYTVLANNYKYTTKKGNIVSPSKKMFTSWVQSVSVLRNICAHNSRIYNRTIHTAPEILDIDKIIPKPQYNGLYQILLAMKYLRPSNEEWTEFVIEFEKLLNENINIIDFKAMNLPKDWKKHLSV